MEEKYLNEAIIGNKNMIATLTAKGELERLYLNVINKNVRAIKFSEKMGFVYEGTFRNHV